MKEQMKEQLLSSNDVSKMLNVTLNALQIWRHKGIGPRYLKLTRRCVRYRLEDVLEWIEDSKIETKVLT